MKKFILVLGGARSGKSRYAVEAAKNISKKVAFIATAQALDEEMKNRILQHKRSRPQYWKILEETLYVNKAIDRCAGKFDVILIDCIGLFVSNLLGKGLTEREIEKEIKKITKSIDRIEKVVIAISNEVGEGIVPDNSLARSFRDALGKANQIMAKSANEVILMCAGIPLTIKKGTGYFFCSKK